MPEHAQTFFKQQVQKYTTSAFNYDKTAGKNWVKERISRLYPYVVVAVMTSYFILVLLCYFYDKYHIDTVFKVWKHGGLDINNQQERQLLEIFNLLIDALNVEPVALRKGPGILGSIGSYLPFFQFVESTHRFFAMSIEAQILTLLHELRHYQQDTSIIIPADIVAYAKSCRVKPYDFDIAVFFMTGFFWSRAILEFDAELSAAHYMKEHPWLSTAVKFRSGSFNSNTGYLSQNMMLKDAPKFEDPSGIQLEDWIDLEHKWNEFLCAQSGENIYLQAVPKHLLDAAAKNRAAKNTDEYRQAERKRHEQKVRENEFQFLQAARSDY